MSNYLKANYISNARNSLGALIIVKSKYLLSYIYYLQFIIIYIFIQQQKNDYTSKNLIYP